MLSFAPSAAAVWHCDRVRITCERNSVRHSVFFKRWVRQFIQTLRAVRRARRAPVVFLLCPRNLPRNPVKNRAECSRFFCCCGPVAAPGFVQLWHLLGPRGRQLGSVLAPFGALCTKSGPKTTLKTGFERRRRPRELPRVKMPQLTHPSGLRLGAKILKNGEKVMKDRVFSRPYVFFDF